MKTKIIKFFIKKNGFFDRERLMSLSEKSLYKLIIIKIYHKLLKSCYRSKAKTKSSVNALEQISNCYSKINFFSRIKTFLKK